MKVMAFLFAAFLCVSVPLFAEKVFIGNDPKMTEEYMPIKKTFLDGEDWIKMDVDTKRDFLTGFQEALSTVRFEIMGILDVPFPPEKIREKPDELSNKNPDEHFSPKHDLDITKQIKYIDIFYSNDRQIRIPIGYAIRIIKDEIRGVPKEDVENHKRALLRMIDEFNKPNKQQGQFSDRQY